MANQIYRFEGWLGYDTDSVKGNMTWAEFEPKPWEETDVDIKVTHSGVCGTDLHTLRNGWGNADYPVCVGHEIVGHAVRVGSRAAGNIQIGDLVGVGAQSDSCLGRQGDCEICSSGQEQYCPKFVATYSGRHFNGAKTMGGHARYHRAPSHFVVKVPKGLAPEFAAPMLCGGATMWSPLKTHGCGPGKKVGVIGVGGLGHFGIIFAQALGADEVVGISRRENKREEVLEMGATGYIATEDEKDWVAKHGQSLDLIVSTVSSSQVPLNEYLGLLKFGGTYVQVGHPDDGKFQLGPGPMIRKKVTFTGSSIASPEDIREMMQLAVDKECQPWVEQRPMSEANQAMVDLDAGKARYRYVLVNEAD